MRAALLACALLSWPACARAQDRPREVDLTFVGDAIDASGLAPVLDELLGRMGVALRRAPIQALLDPREVLTPRPDAPPALARIWIELTAARATIYLVDGGWERILVRHVPTEGGLGEVGREQVALIVQAAVEALLAGARIGLSRADASERLGLPPAPAPPRPPPPPPAAAPRAAPTPLRGDVYLGYAAELFADGPTLRHAIALQGSLLFGPGPERVAVTLAADLRPSSVHEGAGLRLDLRTLVLRLELGVDLELSDDTSLRLAGGVGVDLTAVEPRALPGAGVGAAGASDAAAPVLLARVAVHQRLWEWIALTAGVLLDVDLLDTRYVVLAGGADRTVVDPWLVRPALWLGLGGRLR